MDNDAVGVEVLGSEREGKGFRYLVPIEVASVTGDEIALLWQKLSTQDYSFDDNSRGRGELFVVGLTEPNSLHFRIQDSGYIQVRNAYQGSDASIHFALWDRNFPFSQAKEAGVEVLTHLFNEVKVNRVSGYIPVYNALAKRFATLLGFKFEGELRRSILYKGEYHNISIYGLLKEEFTRRS
jgi:RimJ/RimL family protein N-acetyltransferase